MSAASGGNSEPKQGQRSQSARGFCPRSTMRVPQPDIIEHFGNADAVPQLPERCLSRKAGIVRCCPRVDREKTLKALGVFSCQGYNQKHSVPLSRTKAPAYRLVRFLARDTRKNTPAQAGVFLMTHAGISRSALPCSIPRSGYTKKHSSISWSVFW